jgi:hypothetical protein
VEPFRAVELVWRSVALIVGLTVVLVGCGSGLARQRPDVTRPGLGAATASPATARLARLAQRAARAAGNPHPQFVAYVRSHRRVAVKVSEGGEIVNSNEPVFVVEVVGPFPHNRLYSAPPGVNPSMPARRSPSLSNEPAGKRLTQSAVWPSTFPSSATRTDCLEGKCEASGSSQGGQQSRSGARVCGGAVLLGVVLPGSAGRFATWGGRSAVTPDADAAEHHPGPRR